MEDKRIADITEETGGAPDIRPLFWALIRIGFSVNIGFTGVLMIDILPAFYGYWQVSCVLDNFPDYDRPRALKPVLFLAALLSLTGWFPGIAAAIPAAVDTMLSLAAMACNTLIYYHVLGLLIFLSERAGRYDLAENGRRFRYVYLIPYAVLTLVGIYQGGVQNFWYMLLLIAEMGLPIYAANCDKALFANQSQVS